MNRAELIVVIAERTGLGAREIEQVLEELFGSRRLVGLIPERLGEGERVTISGFGSFGTRERRGGGPAGRAAPPVDPAGRPARQPFFRPGVRLRERVR
jgi:nucleoid DNA-binding protein